jgi:hypothetical protein
MMNVVVSANSSQLICNSSQDRSVNTNIGEENANVSFIISIFVYKLVLVKAYHADK